MPSITIGARLGPYEILNAIGAGGMGEVYRARDTRLDRTVAIKVLASGLASDVQSRERFEREAKAISSLNHPNICALYDVGRERPSGSDEPPVDFLVMEYVEGETLSARLARGPSRATRNAALNRGDAPSDPAAPPSLSVPGGLPPMTVEEALAVAIQIAGALDRAHRQGIVHRDLKPGNVMLSKGVVKLLDFGLARLSRPGAASENKEGLGHGLVSLADLSMPTVSSPLTMKGTILGTLQYMSPEQLEGKEVDARTDIFAFGGVLYEMLTGRRPFEGKSQASLIGAILDHTPPSVTSLQPVSPPLLDEIVARCLAKDPDERWQTARDLKRQLEWVAKGVAGSAGTGTRTSPTQMASPPSRVARALQVGVAVLAGAAIAGGVMAWTLWPTTSTPHLVSRFAVDLPEGQEFSRGGRHLVALSPDGTRLVYVANQQLYLRAMNELTAVGISGTEASDPSEPVFSPDGQWVAFWSKEELKKVPVSGGTPVTLSPAQNPVGASWVGDSVLLGQDSPRGIVAVPANGGTAKRLVTVDEKKGEFAHGPQLLAGGRAVLFTLRSGAGAWDESAIVIHELATDRRTVLVNAGTDGHVLPTGHLVYSRGTTLFAMPFDEATLAVTGGAVPVQEEIRQAGGRATGASQMAWSASGTFVFITESASSGERALVWMNRLGQEERATAPARSYAFGATGLRVSPDGTRVAVQISSDGSASSRIGSDIWVWEIARDSLTRLTFSNQATAPIWTPDSRRVCYDSTTDVLFCQAADGSGQAQTMGKLDGLVDARWISPDGTRMLLVTTAPKSRSDIMMATIAPPTEPRPLIQTVAEENGPAISPDGRWLAYESDESGQTEVYVRPFPAVDQGRWQISTSSAASSEPRWSKNGRELFFATGGAQFGVRVLWSVSVAPGQTFVAGKPSVVAKLSVDGSMAYDVAPDGRFLFHVPASTTGKVASRPQLVVVQHWFDELKARVPVSPR